MFKFLTIVFLMYYIYRLFNPFDNKKFYEPLKQFTGNETKDDLEKYAEEHPEQKEKYFKWGLKLLLYLLEQTIEIIYLIVALKYDIYMIPTVAMLLWWITTLSISTRKAKKRTKEENHKRLFISNPCYRTWQHIFDILYFGYMFYLVVIK